MTTLNLLYDSVLFSNVLIVQESSAVADKVTHAFVSIAGFS